MQFEPAHVAAEAVLDHNFREADCWRRHFLRNVAKIKAAAGIDPEIKFMGLRHGGNTEGADANLSDAQMRALSGHRTTAALLRYAQTSTQQRMVGARLRRNARTKGGQTSE